MLLLLLLAVGCWLLAVAVVVLAASMYDRCCTRIDISNTPGNSPYVACACLVLSSLIEHRTLPSFPSILSPTTNKHTHTHTKGQNINKGKQKLRSALFLFFFFFLCKNGAQKNRFSFKIFKFFWMLFFPLF